MRKVIPFRRRNTTNQITASLIANKNIIPLWDFATNLDTLITSALRDGILAQEEIAAIIANRLGNFIKDTDEKDKILSFCLDTLKKYSHVS